MNFPLTFECRTGHCPRRGTRWIIETKDIRVPNHSGLVMMPAFLCQECGGRVFQVELITKVTSIDNVPS